MLSGIFLSGLWYSSTPRAGHAPGHPVPGPRDAEWPLQPARLQQPRAAHGSRAAALHTRELKHGCYSAEAITKRRKEPADFKRLIELLQERIGLDLRAPMRRANAPSHRVPSPRAAKGPMPAAWRREHRAAHSRRAAALHAGELETRPLFGAEAITKCREDAAFF